jgi:hypothetical protein
MNLFLFPHQDDEVPVFHEIDKLVQSNQPITIVYLTTGQASPDNCERRNRESMRVLEQLGIKASQVHFIGAQIGVADGSLHHHLARLQSTVSDLMKGSQVSALYMPAWEGGHQDHDAAHVLGLALAKEWGCLPQAHQFPYYQGEGLKGILFKTLSPLAQNGQPMVERISVPKRIKYLGLLFAYRSQAKTWIGLGPFFVLHYLFKGTQVLQDVSLARVNQKPHPGALLYERRQFCTFDRFQQETANFLRQHLV